MYIILYINNARPKLVKCQTDTYTQMKYIHKTVIKNHICLKSTDKLKKKIQYAHSRRDTKRKRFAFAFKLFKESRQLTEKAC